MTPSLKNLKLMKKTYNIAIIGAGQLGSRHLQGVKKANVSMNIYVVDPNEDALIISEQRYNEVEENPFIEAIGFFTDITLLPNNLDFAIIATNSRPRAQIINTLVEKNHCQFLLIEKFLFPALSEYANMDNFLKEHQVNAWVNCARRFFPFYQNLKSLLSNEPYLNFEIKGNNWGLCCNGIHFIDLFSYLSGEKDIIFNTDNIDNQLIESKRKGYIEMTGTLIGNTPNGSSISLSSLQNFEGALIININSPNYHIEISEQDRKIKINNVEEEIELYFQSEMTGKYIESIIKTGIVELPTYLESSHLHFQVLQKFIEKYNNIQQLDGDYCPIT